jgi:hypothetical protein
MWGWDMTEGWITMREAISGLSVKDVADRKLSQRSGFGHDECPGERRSSWGRLFGE